MKMFTNYTLSLKQMR